MRKNSICIYVYRDYFFLLLIFFVSFCMIFYVNFIFFDFVCEVYIVNFKKKVLLILDGIRCI